MPKTLRDLYADLQLAMGQEKSGRQKVSTEAFVVKAAELMLTHGVELQASDIHIEPSTDGARVRYRMDGILHEMLELPTEVRDPLIRSIKIKANMTNDAIGRSKPQDGRINFSANGHMVDLRLSSFPTLYGDVLAIRVLDRSAPLMKLTQIGMPESMLRTFEDIIRRPSGLFLVAGPGNSGKTTTLYGALNRLRSPHLKILTLEDPVEYQLDGIGQAQVNHEIGVTFASGLRAILRQDTNVILLGEIRDQETAAIAVRAALTGHVVFSTLHTRHSFGAVLRLMDMEIEPHLIVGSINAVLAQRLVRKICSECKTQDPDAGVLFLRLWERQTGKEPPVVQATRFSKGAGCLACHNTGYQGRMGLFELLVLNEELKRLIIERDSRKLFKAAVAGGMTTMMLDGLSKVAQGITTMAEIIRVTGETAEEI